MQRLTDAERVIKQFAKYFATFGLPDVIVTDNGPPFNSQQFINFFERQGIKVMKSPPHHQQSNRQAERSVTVVKDVFKKMLLDPEFKDFDLQEKLNYFSFIYRNTFVTSIKMSPSKKVFNYKPKTMIDLIDPTKNYKTQLMETPKKRFEKWQNNDQHTPDPFH